MITRLRATWHSINASYWFYPALFSIIALVGALGCVWLDRNGYADPITQVDWLRSARPDGASNMLTVIAGSMIGVASTVFSITIAAVAYASGNYGPRLLTNFMENRGNQFSLATFIGTFVFSITVLRTVRSEEEQALFDTAASDALPGFVPQLSLLVAYALMGLSIAVLVYFLNHIPASIRINTVLQGIGQRLVKDVRRSFPNDDKGQVEMKAASGKPVMAKGMGYVQIVDYERLHRIAEKQDGLLKLAIRTGDFVHPDMPLVYWSGENNENRDEDDCGNELRDCFALGGMRTPSQDLHFLIDELVEIGLRALSPGINDPFTAITALHWLGAATAEFARRDLTRKYGGAKNGDEDRLVLLNDDFAHYLQRGIGSMRNGVATSPAASVVAFDVLHSSATTLNDGTRHADIVREGGQLIEQAKEHLSGPDLHEVQAAYEKFLKKMAR